MVYGSADYDICAWYSGETGWIVEAYGQPIPHLTVLLSGRGPSLSFGELRSRLLLANKTPRLN